MGRRSRPLRRRSATREARKRLLVLCEGKITEPRYLKAFKHEHRSQLVEVEVVPECGDPKTLVESAVTRKREAEKEARRRGDSNLRYDEIWCVFDVDAHPNLAAAVQQAEGNGLNLAVSNPCFELWILLHFQEQRAYEDRARIQSACRVYMPEFLKEVPYEKIRLSYEIAVARAQTLMQWQAQQGRPAGNPSTAVHKLTQKIAELGKEAFLRQEAVG
jgi:hypothetical protein